MSYTGHCKCGGISATIGGNPVGVAQCWCRQCQNVTGGGPVNCAVFFADDIQMTGELATSHYTADSGAACTRSFCAICNTPVMGESASVPQFRSIYLNFLTDGHNLKPETALWTDEAPDGAVIDPSLTRISRQ